MDDLNEQASNWKMKSRQCRIQGSVVKEAVFINYMLDGCGFESPTWGNSISLKDECCVNYVAVVLPCLVFVSISYNQQYSLASRILRTCMPNQFYQESTNIDCNWYLDWTLPSQDCPRMVCVTGTMVGQWWQGSQSHLGSYWWAANRNSEAHILKWVIKQ